MQHNPRRKRERISRVAPVDGPRNAPIGHPPLRADGHKAAAKRGLGNATLQHINRKQQVSPITKGPVQTQTQPGEMQRRLGDSDDRSRRSRGQERAYL